jgi:class 3 adenylate cyclase/pimeloyl-ACP methyl ester carboxylesterase
VLAPDTRYAKNDDGLAIAYQTVGEGPTDIVFLPVFGCIDQHWDDPEYTHLLSRLADIGRLILLDARGIGASDPVPLGGLPTPERWVDDLHVVLDAVESENAAVVAAGMFGIMGMVFAATFPERTKALVLIDSYARWLRADDYPGPGTSEGIESIVDIFRQTWGTGISTLMSIPSRADDPAFRRWVARAERLTASPAELAAYWTWGLSLDVREILPVIQAPTLVVHNDPATVTTIELSQYLASNIGGARLLSFKRRDSYLFSRVEGDRLIDHIEEFVTGAPPLPDPGRSLSTVLFTDIVGSTEHAVRLGDKRWSDLLGRHDQILDAELARHRGRKVLPTGDGLLATFDGPERAIRCAKDICGAVRRLDLEIRAGVHTGEVLHRGQSIDGIAVHIGQRVTAMARSGEVLVSSTVRNLVTGSDLRFVDRGFHELKGMPEAWQLFALES